jgi:hypothetical protein
MLQRQRLAAEAVEQEQKEEEFHLQQAQVRTCADTRQPAGLSYPWLPSSGVSCEVHLPSAVTVSVIVDACLWAALICICWLLSVAVCAGLRCAPRGSGPRQAS